jgi:hypothetical protein
LGETQNSRIKVQNDIAKFKNTPNHVKDNFPFCIVILIFGF